VQPQAGTQTFYVDNRGSSTAARVELQRLLLFEPA
jgi:hypothetical protein